MKFNRYFVAFTVLLLVGLTAHAQSTTGTLNGTVTQSGSPLPGVTVTISSPAMQGSRRSVTNDTGSYVFQALPPGEYSVRVEMDGMQTATTSTRVGLGGTARADADLRMSAVAEAITVIAAAPAVMETTEVQSNYTAKDIEQLPIDRTLFATTSLAPGVVQGINGLAISGSNSYDNLWTVNGAVVNENIRGQPHNLFIEDAIQEMTIQTAGISAEFGNFTGGVINAITRSGGNQFSGSFRDSFTNPSWTNDNPFRNPTTGAKTPEPINDTSEVYEATLGGRIIRDRLWFFGAARHADTSFEDAFSNSEVAYTRGTLDERYEVKLTGAITPKHSLVASYLNADSERVNECLIGCYDKSSVNPTSRNPNDFKSAQYNGIFGNDFLLEARYSDKSFSFVNSGGRDRNLITGTPVRLAAPGFNTITNEPYFCGSCGASFSDNESMALKGTYYLSSPSLGTHNIAIGGERFNEVQHANAFQSPTDYVAFLRTTAPTRDASGNPLVSVGNNDIIFHFPILQLSKGSDLNSNGFYINDQWDLNNKLSFNLGARYDKNDSRDRSGNPVSDDDKVSPRLGIAYDLFGNGRLRLNANYGTYVNRLSEGVSSAGSAAGRAATSQYLYGGPVISNVAPEVAVAQVFAWADSQGGFAALPACSATRTTGCLLAQSFPGFTSRLEGRLVSPSVDEWTIGAGMRIGNGFVRADYINREWNDFYTIKANLGIGGVTNPTGARADLTLTGNSNDFTRAYEAVEVQGQYRLSTRVNLGGNYTYSELKGNIIGEALGNGPVASVGNEFYPEYFGYERNKPVGFLPQDQTHKARVWAGVDVPTIVGDFNVSVLQRYDSGAAYSLTGAIDPRFNANFYGTGQPGGIVNPGYVSPPTAVNYFFSDRGALRFEDLTATDLAINYRTRMKRLRGAQLFIQGELLNAFNEHALIGHDTSILTAANNPASCNANPGNADCLRRFNPIAGDVPVEGVHWRKGPNFGKATVSTAGTNIVIANPNTHIQTPRTIQFSAGIRF